MTNVCLSVDVECTIGGAFKSEKLFPIGDQALWCMVSGRSEGLGYLLDTFAKYDINGTFFVETNNSHYFKASPMRKAALQIHAEGHELQLHCHPCWSVFEHADWRRRSRECPNLDDFVGLKRETTVALVKGGQALFDEWNLPPPTIFRSGNLQHDDNLYQALAECGIKTSSSVGVGIFDSGNEQYTLYSGQHMRHGVLELPVLTFRDRRMSSKPALKSLTIAGTSFDETRILLDAAEGEGIDQVVILTHPFEFIQTDNVQYSHTRQNFVNRRRLEQLCSYLQQHRSRFSTVGISTAAEQAAKHISDRNVLLRTEVVASTLRKFSNVVYQQYGNALLLVDRRGS